MNGYPRPTLHESALVLAKNQTGRKGIAMSVDILLSRLDGVKRTGHEKWIAKCPAHDDRSPSLVIKEADDGRVLIHCFAGCGAAEILDVLDLNFPDLYPQK